MTLKVRAKWENTNQNDVGTRHLGFQVPSLTLFPSPSALSLPSHCLCLLVCEKAGLSV